MKRYHCPSCFLFSEDEIKTSDFFALSDTTEEKLCEFCFTNPKMTKKQLLERRLEVLDSSWPSDFPKTIRLLYDVLKEKDKK